jgi:hypothetical protein
VIRRKLPFFPALKKTVIKGRLAFEKIDDITAVPFRLSRDEFKPVQPPEKPTVRPDVAVSVFVGGIDFFALNEPGMFLGSVSGYQIQQYPNVPFMGLGKKPEEVFVAAIAVGDLLVIPHIVPRVPERRVKTGVNPQRVTAKPPDIIKFFDYPLNVAYAVAIGIVKRLRINLIKNRVSKPFRHVLPHFKKIRN